MQIENTCNYNAKTLLLIFVYGTLKRGMSNHHVLEALAATYISSDITIEKYPMFDLGHGYPYLQDTKGIGNRIEGEIYELDSSNLRTIDEFECSPTLYHRGKVTVMLDREPVEVSAYFKTKELTTEQLFNIPLFNSWEGK